MRRTFSTFHAEEKILLGVNDEFLFTVKDVDVNLTTETKITRQNAFLELNTYFTSDNNQVKNCVIGMKSRFIDGTVLEINKGDFLFSIEVTTHEQN